MQKMACWTIFKDFAGHSFAYLQGSAGAQQSSQRVGVCCKYVLLVKQDDAVEQLVGASVP